VAAAVAQNPETAMTMATAAARLGRIWHWRMEMALPWQCGY
jgi:hypothetical protein